jgi:cob(I)alamin adenosyltransferase
MAEAVAVIGLVASIVQLTQFGTTIVVRLNEFQSSAKEIPICFREIQTQLPLLVDTLKRTQKQADAGHVSDETAKALKPVVDGCLSQVERLESILTKALPTKKDSSLRRTYKALSSFIHEKDVQQITSSLESYVQKLTYHHASQFPTVDPSPSKLHTAAQKKCFMVQFERDPYFVGRQDIIKEIDERLKLRPHRVALAGIGGVGYARPFWVVD